jgi:hypothetical protein
VPIQNEDVSFFGNEIHVGLIDPPEGLVNCILF